MATPGALAASALLRDPSQFKWYAIPLLLIVIYVYAVEIEKKNWPGITAALAFWGLDIFNEIWNSLIFHFTGYSAFWVEVGPTAYQLLIGLNIETTFMFAIMGIVATKMIPKDKEAKIFGKLPNRITLAVMMSLFCVIVEIILHSAGALVWDYPFWSLQFPFLIFFIGYFPFWYVAFKIYDAHDLKTRVKGVLVILGIDGICVLIFGLLNCL
ncbi:MAG TPA: hypothetical protein VKM55_22495 [Candidatus Lokiarchaeia archaeon]|nr:hypothetical protein [Candidatus Lokiarchaeia archaeon]